MYIAQYNHVYSINLYFLTHPTTIKETFFLYNMNSLEYRVYAMGVGDFLVFETSDRKVSVLCRVFPRLW